MVFIDMPTRLLTTTLALYDIAIGSCRRRHLMNTLSGPVHFYLR